MSYFHGIGADEQPATLQLVADRTAEIIERQKADASSRRWATIFAVAGAVFAAVKLGVIAIPHLRRRAKTHQLGQTGSTANPHRRRGRRV